MQAAKVHKHWILSIQAYYTVSTTMIWPTDILALETWVLIFASLGLARYYLYNRKWQYLSKLGIPHDPPAILQIGHAKKLFGETAFTYENDCKKRLGPVYGTYFGTAATITIHDPDILRQIFIKEFPNFPMRQNFFVKVNGKEMNSGLNLITGDQWKRVRSAMSPTFSTSKLKEMTGIIAWCADNTIEVLNRKNKTGNGNFDVKDLFSRLSLDIVCSAAFSTNVQSQDDTKEEPEIAKHAKRLFGGSIMNPIILLLLFFPSLERLMEKKNWSVYPKPVLRYFKRLTNHLIEQREKNPNAQNRVDLMQLMLDAEVSEEELKNGASKGMSRSEIVGNSIVMILAGYENTANTMGFLAYNLATHPQVQAEVQKEIDQMLETHGKFDYEGVNSLKFLDMCLNETLRLYQPLLRNARICTKETTINGLTIPSGMLVSIPVYALSHDPDYWQDPFEFKPERMRDMGEIDPMMFQPFGAGPRNCIGMRFAIMEVKMSISKLLHKFTFKSTESTPKPPLKLAFRISVRPAVNIELRAVPRDNVADS